MRIIVKFFGEDKQVVGADQVEMDITIGMDAAGLVLLLEQKFSQVSFHPEQTTILINQTLMAKDATLKDGDLVYILHPLSGGYY